MYHILLKKSILTGVKLVNSHGIEDIVEKCEKLCEKSVDMVEIVRYNGGSLSKSPLRPLQKEKGKRGNLLRSL